METSVLLQVQPKQNCICCSPETTDLSNISRSWITSLPLFNFLNPVKSNCCKNSIKTKFFQYKYIKRKRKFRNRCLSSSALSEPLSSSRQLSVHGRRIKGSIVSIKRLKNADLTPSLNKISRMQRTPKAMSSVDYATEDEPNTCNRGTSTIPIQYQSHSTQTDRRIIESEESDDVEDEIKHLFNKPDENYNEPLVRDQSTSPLQLEPGLSMGYSKTYFENLEKLTGHIIIHRFITKSDEEFQHLIQISVPHHLKPNQEEKERESFIKSETKRSPMHGSTSSNPTPNAPATSSKSVSMTLIPLLEDEENRNNDLQNISLSTQKENHDHQMNNEHHNILTSKEPTFLTKVSKELENEVKKPCQNDIGLNEFRISLDTLLEEEKEEEGDGENEDEGKANNSGPESDNNDDNESQSTVALGDTIIGPMNSTKFLEEEETRGLLAMCDSNWSTIPCECFSFPPSESNLNFSIEAEVGTGETVDSDDEDSSSIIQSVNYFGEKDDAESETESIASSVNEEVVVMTDDGEHGLANPCKNIATQTDEKSFCKYFKKLKSSINLSANSNATTTSESSSMSLLDVELHVEKLDLRVRVGGKNRKQKKKRLGVVAGAVNDDADVEKSLVVGIRRNHHDNMTRRQLHLLKPIDEKSSTARNVNEDELDFLEVKGRRILL